MTCRLCDGAVREVFTKRVLNKHDVQYFECLACRSLETERPYWLREAYESGNLTLADTGPVLRSLNSQAIVTIASRILGLPPSASVLDYGGGSGLLCRLLRDQGFDARVLDSYAPNDLARGFSDNGRTPDIRNCSPGVTADRQIPACNRPGPSCPPRHNFLDTVTHDSILTAG
jgi:hypothetical protein